MVALRSIYSSSSCSILLASSALAVRYRSAEKSTASGRGSEGSLLRNAPGSGHSSAVQAPRGGLAASLEEVSSVPVGRRASCTSSLALVAVFWLRGAASCCNTTFFSLRPAPWWSAGAGAMAINCCSCLSMARSRRSLRRWAWLSCLLAIISSTSDTKRKGTLARRRLVVVVVLVLGFVVRTYDTTEELTLTRQWEHQIMGACPCGHDPPRPCTCVQGPKKSN